MDDEWGRELAGRLGPTTVTVSTSDATARRRAIATWTAADIVTAADGRTRFRAVGQRGPVEAGCAIAGRYNVANVLLALAVLDALGVAPDVAAPAVAAAQVPGRMERIEAGQDFLAVVDYAHKPAAVDGALRALRPLTEGRLIVVLGCGGDRDRDKRPVMGRVAAEQADVAHRHRRQPALGGPGRHPPRRPGRGARSRRRPAAPRSARSATGPTRSPPPWPWPAPVTPSLVAGKGHETGQDVGGVVHPFDDRQVLRDLLANR